MARVDRLGCSASPWTSRPLTTSSQLPSVLRLHLNNNNIKNRKSRISSKGESSNGSAPDESQLWMQTGFPQYLQESVEASDFCTILEEAKARQSGALSHVHNKDSSLWRSIRREAEKDAQMEPLLSSFLYASILSHDTFERSLAFVLANRLSDATLLSTELFEVFHTVLKGDRKISEASMADLCAVRERDPACSSYSQALLYFKGYHALQVQRIAHSLWHAGRRVMAVALQSRASEVFAVDIHPAAKIGKGVLLDHGTGVVIGETAEVGNNVSILQNVTLGGTGKQHGDRHPKVSDNVLIGASATILGNIRIGKGAQVAAGSLVLKAVPDKTMVAGSPAKEVGKVSGNPALNMEQWNEMVIKDVMQTAAATGVEQSKTVMKPCEDLFAAPAQAKSAGNGAVLGQHAQAAPRAAPPVPSTSTPAQAASPPPKAAAAHHEEKQTSSSAVNEPQPAQPVVVEARPGAPPAVKEKVDAVTSDVAAKQKWGESKGGDDMEYMI